MEGRKKLRFGKVSLQICQKFWKQIEQKYFYLNVRLTEFALT